MGNFFERFTDLDRLKEQASDLLDRGMREGKRQVAVNKLKLQLFDLDRRMNAEFRVLGERVWTLHCDDTLTRENLTGVFDKLEELAEDIDEAKVEMARLEHEPDDPEADVEAVKVQESEGGPPPPDPDAAQDRNLEPSDGSAPLE